MISIVLGIVFQALVDMPLLYYIPLIVIAAVLAVWRHRFLCLAVFALAAVNLECYDVPETTLLERDTEYSGIVLGEECYEHYTRLTIHVDRIIFGADTIRYVLPVEYYTRDRGHFLGRRVNVKGRVRKAKRIYRPALLTGRIIDSIEREHIFGFLFNPIRQYMDRLLSDFFDSDQYRIASGLTLGGSGRLNRELKSAFSRSGTLHILAVSGLHVGFVGAFFGVILLFLPLGHRVKFAVIMGALFVYAGVTGFRPSVCRATLMAFLFGLALISQRNVVSMHIVNTTAIVFLLARPTLLFDVGAQLSFTAVYGIVFLYPILDDSIIKKIRKRSLKVMLRMVAVSFSAQLFVAPLLIYYFNVLPLYSVFANLLIVPLASSVIFVLFVCFSIGWISCSLARMIALPAVVLIDILTVLSRFFANLPFSALKINITPLVTFPLYLLVWKRMRKVLLLSAMVVILLISLFQSVDYLAMYASPRGILILMPDGTRIYLTDKISGKQNALLQKHGADRLDYLVANSRIYPVKREFIEWPEELNFLMFGYNGIRIFIDERLQIEYRRCKMEFPRSQFAENADDGEYVCILSNGKNYCAVKSTVYNTFLEQMLVDLRLAFARIRLLF